MQTYLRVSWQSYCHLREKGKGKLVTSGFSCPPLAANCQPKATILLPELIRAAFHTSCLVSGYICEAAGSGQSRFQQCRGQGQAQGVQFSGHEGKNAGEN